MKKIASLLVTALLLAALAMVGMAEEEQSHVLIAYYSRTGTTQEAAERIAELTGGDLVKLETVQAYPEDYTETTEVAKAELEANARPELSTVIENMDDYDTIYLGYPIWWHYAPMAINTFIESYDLSGKTIIPFCTSASSGIDASAFQSTKRMLGAATRAVAMRSKDREGKALFHDKRKHPHSPRSEKKCGC